MTIRYSNYLLFKFFKPFILLVCLCFVLCLVTFGQANQNDDSSASANSSSTDVFFIIDIIGPTIYFNLGFNQGVKKGMRFNILGISDDTVNITNPSQKGWLIVSETYADVSKGELKEVSGLAPEIGDLIVFDPQLSTIVTGQVSPIKSTTPPMKQVQTTKLIQKPPQFSINWKRLGIVGVGLMAGYLSLKSHRSMEQSLQTYNTALNNGQLTTMNMAKDEVAKYHRNRLFFGFTAASLLGFYSYQKFLNSGNIWEKNIYKTFGNHSPSLSPFYLSISSLAVSIGCQSNF